LTSQQVKNIKKKRRIEKRRESEAIDTGNETNLSETQPTCVSLLFLYGGGKK